MYYTTFMLLVKTRLEKSNIHGLGLFADQLITKGTVTWQRNEKFDIGFNESNVANTSEEFKKYFFHYAYYDKKNNYYVLCCDNQRFINHSQDSRKINIDSTPDQDVAARDIQPGEELLCDYNQFDDTYFNRLNIKKGDLL